MEFAWDQFKAQNFACNVSKIPFQSPSETSLERKNENGGYTTANCCFIMRWFQRVHHQPGKMQWTHTKCSSSIVITAMTASGGRKLSKRASGERGHVVAGSRRWCGYTAAWHRNGQNIRKIATKSDSSSRNSSCRMQMSTCNNLWTCTRHSKGYVLFWDFFSDWTPKASEGRPPTGRFHQSEWIMTADTP